MTHGFTSGKLLAQQALIERTGVGEFVEYNDGTDTFKLFSSDGSPEGVLAADKGSQAADITNGALYIKTTDTANTGWLAASTGGGGAWTELSSATISGTPTTVDFTANIDSTYVAYAFLFKEVVVSSTSARISLRTSSDGGSTWDSTAGDYYFATFGNTSGSTWTGIESIIETYFVLNRGAGTVVGQTGRLNMYSPSTSDPTHFDGDFTGAHASSAITNHPGGCRSGSTAVNAVQFQTTVDTFTSGKITLYGAVLA